MSWYCIPSICLPGPEGESLAISFADTPQSPRVRLKRTLALCCYSGSLTEFYRRFPFGTTFVPCDPITQSAPKHSQRGRRSTGNSSFVAGSRSGLAPTSAPPAKARASTAKPAASGGKWHESSVRYDLATSSWKTHRSLFPEVLPWSSVTLPKWGMMRGGECWERTMPERRTGESGSGLWHTPRASDTGKGENPETFVKRNGDRTAACTGSLAAQIMWRTPCATDGTNGGPNARDSKGGLHLTAQVMWPTATASCARSEGMIVQMRVLVEMGKTTVEEAEAMIGGSLTPPRMSMWQTPTVEDAGRTGSAEDMRKYLENGQTSGCRLRNQVQMWPTPTGQDNPQVAGQYPDHPKRGTTLGGAVRQWPTPVAHDHTNQQTKYAQGGTPLSMSVQMFPTPQANEDAAGTPNGKMQRMLGNCEEVRGKTEAEWAGGSLNPAWTCWLMGWPLGYTALTPLSPKAWAAWQRAFRAGPIG